MKKKILIGSIVVALIVLSSFSSVVGKVSSDEELVEFNVEFSGLGKKHTVQLTQQEADEVELLFDEIEERLSKVETRDEAEEIFKEAVVELDRYGLLGGLSVRQAQRLVTGKYQKSSNNGLRKSNPSNDELYNTHCLVLGTSLSHTYYFPTSLIKSIFNMISYFLHNRGFILLSILFSLIYSKIRAIIFDVKPIHFYCDVAFGYMVVIPPLYHYVYPASGTIYTIGVEGIKSLSGEFFGLFDLSGYRTGMIGFTGLKISNNLIGFAKEIDLKKRYT